MKYRYLALAVSLLLALTACGAENLSDSRSVPEPEGFGVAEIGSAPAPAAETTQAPAAPEPEQPVEAPDEAPVEADNLDELALTSVILSSYLDDQAYDLMSSGCFWRSVAYLAGLAGDRLGTVQADGRVTFPEQALEAMVTALFGPYPGQYPSLSEEDPMVTEEVQDGQTVYAVHLPGSLDYTVAQTGTEPQEDGTERCRVELRQGDTVLGTYTAVLTAFPEGVTGPFSRCITDLEPD